VLDLILTLTISLARLAMATQTWHSATIAVLGNARSGSGRTWNPVEGSVATLPSGRGRRSTS
jgi:hypothetical protein